MSNNKMLVDATHPEETRVVVLRGGRVEEFDYESAARKLLRGNIYLAKVTRVEPALQAAFVDYGGNRHGFLAFNEIHPDYYQIPVADRIALIEEEAAAEAEEEAAADARAEAVARRQAARGEPEEASAASDAPAGDNDYDDEEDDEDEDGAGSQEPEDRGRESEDDDDAEMQSDQPGSMAARHSSDADDFVSEPTSFATDEAGGGAEDAIEPGHNGTNTPNERPPSASETGDGGGVQDIGTSGSEPGSVEQVGSEDALEELPSRPRRRPRSYKIQEVIRRRQIILVQVVKEERGNKGAALTTYLSLAGRYTVLMPNTARGGGISRKITNPQDRKRLKAIAAELEVPEGMGLIIRTAGAARTKQEIKRDFEYLLRLWESVRDLTLQSTAPSLVYEEGNLIKRSIRDLYNKDVDEVIVAGGEAFKEAKDFMRMLMPSHAKNVVPYQDPEPLFTKFQIERQLNAMFSPYVTLKSGGYLVINQTEALVAVDVNSGKSTREYSIEETALNTNLEASDEIARQLKLRDLAGLVVIDFIDMEEKRNNRAVERRMKDALRFDRARIQVGRISHFGLMEMSRQRLRTGVLEGSTTQCPHCQGTGIIRSTESVALAVLRGIEDTLMAGAHTPLIATTTPTVALYILNNKRAFINEMEARHGLPITVQGSEKVQGANFTVEKGAAIPGVVRNPNRTAVNMNWGFEGEGEGDGETVTDIEPAEVDDSAEPADDSLAARDGDGSQGGRRRRGRRGNRRDQLDSRGGAANGRGGRRDEPVQDAMPAHDDDRGPDDPDDGGADDDSPISAGAGAEDPNGERRRRRGRRRGRRGGRRGRERDGAEQVAFGGQGTELDGVAGAAHEGNGHEPANAPDRSGPALAPVTTSEQTHEPTRRRSDAGADGGAVEPTRHDRQRPPRTEPKTARPELLTPATSVRETAPAEAVMEDRSRSNPAQAEPAARHRNRLEPSEPRLERVLVTPDAVASGGHTDPGQAEQPARKGWWQRKFGGE